MQLFSVELKKRPSCYRRRNWRQLLLNLSYLIFLVEEEVAGARSINLPWPDQEEGMHSRELLGGIVSGLREEGERH